MNPSLFSNSQPQNIDFNQINNDRSFASQAVLTSQDYSTCVTRTHNDLNNSSLNQTLPVPTNTGGLDYTSQPSILENTFNPAHTLLAGPQSTLDIAHATSNASSTENFPPSLFQYTSPMWSGQTMTDFRQTRPPAIHPQVSPSLSYSHPVTLGSHFLGAPTRGLEPYTNNYPYQRPLTGLDQQPFFNRSARSPMHQSLTVPTNCSSSVPFVPLPVPPSRPEGPPFDDTKIIYPLVTDRRTSLTPDISASIQKGFFQFDGKWTCYRRNYFTVACAFVFKNGPPEGPVYLQRHSQLEMVCQYGVSISAKTGTGSAGNQDSEVRNLVQHTPKRDKATESVPGRHVVQPAPFHSLHQPCVLPPPAMYSGSHHMSSSHMTSYESYGAQSHAPAPTSYTFERIQFQKATANNGKRRAQQQFFHVVVELSVNIGRPGGENWVIVATSQSHPMVVRGRSPGHYKDNIRRDGHTDADHRGGTGAGGGGSNNLAHSHDMPASGGWSSNHRHNHLYGGGYPRYGGELQYSHTPSTNSNSTTSVSPTNSDLRFGEKSVSQCTSPYDLEKPILSPISRRHHDSLMSLSLPSYNRRQLYGINEPEADSGFLNSSDGLSPRGLEFMDHTRMRPSLAS